MSARPKTSHHEICEAVRHLLEKGTGESLSMEAIANAVGVRPPSLYKRFSGRADLLSAAAHHASRELGQLLNDPPDARETYESLERMGHVYRKFAKKNPRTYALIFSETMMPRADLQRARQAAAEPMLALLTPIMGKDSALHGARMLVSYLHGFLSMELAKAFCFGGNVNEAFQYGLTKTLRSVLGESVQDL